MGLISELRRRNVIRMAALYVVAAWLIMQVAEVVVTLGELPAWIGPIVLLLLALGFPIALILSWFYELTPEGVSLEKDIEPGDSITHITGRHLDFVIISVLAAAVLMFAYDKWWVQPPDEQSIAVLPFVNLGGDAEQEYFSDGLTEDILNLLARIPELKVIARDSAFSFKGQDIGIPAIRERLNVAHVLTGSVRRAGDRLRITAQLIDAGSDTQIWSDTYDRNLGEVFAIQDEIAASVVGELRLNLLGDMPRAFETDPKAYELFLLARNFATSQDVGQAEEILNEVLDIDPDFAPAWTFLGRIVRIQTSALDERPVDEGYELARQLILRSIELDPTYGQSYAALAQIEFHYDWNFSAALDHLQLALELDPGDSDILFVASRIYFFLGQMDASRDFAERLVTRHPEYHLGHIMLGSSYSYLGRMQEARASLRKAHALMPTDFTACWPGFTYLLEGDASAALAQLEESPETEFCMLGMVMAHWALDNLEKSDEYMDVLIDLWRQGANYQLAQTHAYRGEIDSAFEQLNLAYTNRHGQIPSLASDPFLANLHVDPRWEPLLEKVGLPH